MYEDITVSGIKSDILAAVEKSLSVGEGTFAYDMAAGTALAIYKAYKALNSVPSIVWVDETSGAWLDEAARDAGIAWRKAGVSARVLVEVTGVAGTVIPKGTQFYVADNVATMDSMAFKSVEDGRISASGTSTIEVEALNTGIVGNVPAGSIETLSGMIVGLSSVRQPLAATGGADSESDKALYKRIDASRKKPQTSGNVYDYEKWSLSVSGVGAVKVFPLWDGAGTVKVLIVSEDKKPVDIDTILRCHSHIEENRPIGATVTVATPSTVLVNVSAKVICSNDVETTALMFSKKLGEYIGGIAFLESEILLSRVGAALIATEGISDYTDLFICGEQKNLILATDELPIVGEIVLTALRG